MSLEEKIDLLRLNNSTCLAHYVKKVDNKYIFNKTIDLFKIKDIKEDVFYLLTKNNGVFFGSLDELKTYLYNNNYYKYDYILEY